MKAVEQLSHHVILSLDHRDRIRRRPPACPLPLGQAALEDAHDEAACNISPTAAADRPLSQHLRLGPIGRVSPMISSS